MPRAHSELNSWASKLLGELRDGLSSLVPLLPEERDFILRIRNAGEIKPELITGDKQLAEIICLHPAIKWAALHSQR